MTPGRVTRKEPGIFGPEGAAPLPCEAAFPGHQRGGAPSPQNGPGPTKGSPQPWHWAPQPGRTRHAHRLLPGHFTQQLQPCPVRRPGKASCVPRGPGWACLAGGRARSSRRSEGQRASRSPRGPAADRPPPGRSACGVWSAGRLPPSGSHRVAGPKAEPCQNGTRRQREASSGAGGLHRPFPITDGPALLRKSLCRRGSTHITAAHSGHGGSECNVGAQTPALPLGTGHGGGHAGLPKGHNTNTAYRLDKATQ